MNTRKFRALSGTRQDYARQGYIFFSSLNFPALPEDARRTIRTLCQTVGGPHADALLEYMTTSASAITVCSRHHIASETTLYRLRREYYRRFPQSL